MKPIANMSKNACLSCCRIKSPLALTLAGVSRTEPVAVIAQALSEKLLGKIFDEDISP